MSETSVVVGSRTDGSAHIYYYRDAASQTWYEIAIEEDGSSTTVALPEAPEVADDPEDQSDSVTVEVSDQSLYWHDQQNERDNTRIEFEDGVYWTNRESWAHAYSRDLAYATGQNLDGWNPDETFNWQPPNLIFNGGDAAYATSAQIEELQSKDPSEIDNMDCPSTYDYLI